MSALHANIAVAVAVLLLGVSLVLAGVALIAYKRIQHRRLLWVGIAMLGFAAEGAWLLMDFFARRSELAAQWDPLAWLAVANLAIVGSLYMAVLRD